MNISSEILVRTISAVFLMSLFCYALLWRPMLWIALLFLSAIIASFEWQRITRCNRAMELLGITSIFLVFFSVFYISTDVVFLAWFLLTVWSTDIGGYVIGKKIGGHKLAPEISPNKTFSGALGGLSTSLIVSTIFILMLSLKFKLIICTPIISCCAQLGDLLESQIKRRFGVKDSGRLIPGHGGILDRMDSMIFAAPIALIIFCCLY